MTNDPLTDELDALRAAITSLQADAELAPETNALDLGLDSLDFVMIADQIERSFGCMLPIGEWFAVDGETGEPTRSNFVIENIAAYIARYRTRLQGGPAE